MDGGKEGAKRKIKGSEKEDKRERKGSDGVETPSNKDGLTIEKRG